MSIMGITLEILETVKKEILFTELVNRVADCTSYSKLSIRSTLADSQSSSGFKGNKTFQKQWKVLRDPSRVCRLRYCKNMKSIYDADYEHPEKSKAVALGLSGMLNLETAEPRVLTLASSSGSCVKKMLDVYPYADIVNIERDKAVLDKFQKLGLPTTDYLTTLEDFIENDDLDFDFINLDLMGYASDNKDKIFKTIVEKTTASAICLNYQYTRGWRGNPNRDFVQNMKTKYSDCKDQTLAWVCDIFKDFELTKEHVYKRDPNVQCVSMRLLCFEKP